jgi:hypothetical protein
VNEHDLWEMGYRHGLRYAACSGDPRALREAYAALVRLDDPYARGVAAAYLTRAAEIEARRP